MAGNDEITANGTRRIVGREVLRRASAMVQQWQRDEAEKAALAKTLFIAFMIVGVLAVLFVALR